MLVHRLLRFDRLKQLVDWCHVMVLSETHFEKVRRARVMPNRAIIPNSQGLEQTRPVFLTPRDSLAQFAAAYTLGWDGDSTPQDSGRGPD